MQKLLIADPSDGFTDGLVGVFKNDFTIEVCHDGNSAKELLQSFQPDVLVINLLLPYTDGLTVLQQSTHQPAVILAVAPYVTPYIEHRAASLGIQYLMITPAIQALRVRLLDLVANTAAPKASPADQTILLLHTLHFQTHLDGYQQLCIGIPMFARSPGMRLSKELYPAIAGKFGPLDARTVEHSIRKSIESAWRHKDPLIWAKYFPPDEKGRIPCPSNKVFISRLAELLITDE